MLHELINFFLVIILVMIQSVAGVGVLVLGTPTLLLLDISLIETMNYLLPISIIVPDNSNPGEKGGRGLSW